jgi:hypothetical protein
MTTDRHAVQLIVSAFAPQSGAGDSASTQPGGLRWWWLAWLFCGADRLAAGTGAQGKRGWRLLRPASPDRKACRQQAQIGKSAARARPGARRRGCAGGADATRVIAPSPGRSLRAGETFGAGSRGRVVVRGCSPSSACAGRGGAPPEPDEPAKGDQAAPRCGWWLRLRRRFQHRADP